MDNGQTKPPAPSALKPALNTSALSHHLHHQSQQSHTTNTHSPVHLHNSPLSPFHPSQPARHSRPVNVGEGTTRGTVKDQKATPGGEGGGELGVQGESEVVRLAGAGVRGGGERDRKAWRGGAWRGGAESRTVGGRGKREEEATGREE